VSGGGTIGVRPGSRRAAIDRRLAGAYAHDRIASALYDVVVDALEFGPCSLHRAEARNWVRDAMAAPLQASTDAAIVVLRRDLRRALETAPVDVTIWLAAPPD
jgi:hypothetical protein